MPGASAPRFRSRRGHPDTGRAPGAADHIGPLAAVLFCQQRAVRHRVTQKERVVAGRRGHLAGHAVAALRKLVREHVEEFLVGNLGPPVRNLHEGNGLHVGQCRPGSVHNVQRVVNADRVEAEFATGPQEPLPQRWPKGRTSEGFQAQRPRPCLPVVVLIPEIWVEVIDPETQECIALRSDQPPAVVLFHPEEPGRPEAPARPPPEAVQAPGSCLLHPCCQARVAGGKDRAQGTAQQAATVSPRSAQSVSPSERHASPTGYHRLFWVRQSRTTPQSGGPAG